MKIFSTDQTILKRFFYVLIEHNSGCSSSCAFGIILESKLKFHLDKTPIFIGEQDQKPPIKPYPSFILGAEQRGSYAAGRYIHRKKGKGTNQW